MAPYSTLTAADVDLLGRRYATTFDEVAPFAGGSTNSAHRARTPRGPVVVTILDAHTPASAHDLAALMCAVAAAGLPTAKVWRTTDGSPTVVLDHDGEAKPVLVMDLVTGHHVRPLSRTQVAMAGALTARIHRIAPPPVVPTGRRRIPTAWRAAVGPDAPAALQAVLASAERWWEQLKGLRSGLIHGDLFDDNLLARPDGTLAVLDWETASVEPFVLDLGIATIGLCRVDGRLDQARCEALVSGYDEEQALTSGESAALPAAIAYGAAVLAFNRYHQHVVQRATPGRQRWWVEMVDLAAALDGATGPGPRAIP